MTLAMNIHPYCNCTSRGVHQKQDGFTLDTSSRLWVCSRCRKPSKMNYDRYVLGINPIPQPRRAFDIWEYEMMHAFNKEAPGIIAAELDWDDDPETDYDYDNLD